MKKIQHLMLVFVLACMLPTQAISQVRNIPIYFHVMDNGTTFTSFLTPTRPTIEKYLADLVCEVNKTFAGTNPEMLAAIGSGSFPTAYIPRIADMKVRFFIKGIDHISGYSGGGQTVRTGHMKEYNRAINIFLYNFAPTSIFSSDPTARFLPVLPTPPTAEGGGPGQMDIIMLRSTAFTIGGPSAAGAFNEARGTLSHELGHFFGLDHLVPAGALASGTCGCPSGPGDCCGDTPDGTITTSCNMSATLGMPQNAMQEGSSCRVLFTHNQKTLFDGAFAGPVPCNRSAFVDASPAHGGHSIPAISIARSTLNVVTIRATYSSCEFGGPVKFSASVARWEGNVTCREGVGVMTGWNPINILTALAPRECTYRVTVRALWADGSFYDYDPVVYTGTGFPYIFSPFIRNLAQRFCQCSKPWVSDTKRDALNDNEVVGLDHMIEVKEDDVIDIPALLGMESIESVMGASLNALEVFPNPSESSISFKNFDATGFNYRITNVVGQVVEEGTMSSDKISVAKLPGGQYLVQLSDKSDNRSNVMKFVKAD